jgi:hypothetical protein
MELSDFEKEIVRAIGKHYPLIFSVLDNLKVTSREYTCAGAYIDFEPIDIPLVSHTQLLDLHGSIYMSGVELSAHIEMQEGVPQFLEIYCHSQKGWDGEVTAYEIIN